MTKRRESCDWCPGATISLSEQPCWPSSGRKLLYTMLDCPKILHWTPSAPQFLSLQNIVVIEYLEDGNTRQEMLVTEKEADERASRAVYDGLDMVHIAVTRTLSVGTSTVWLRAERNQFYRPDIVLDVRLIVEFGNSEECTRFLHEDLRELKLRDIFDVNTDVAAIGDIMRALVPIADNLLTAEDNAAARCVPYSQLQSGQ
ncbi:hypothetical protein BDN71DRAFT_256955 [Pleurotus eryngii]|uniref:Uncharacterized protein n=1 Tax=Pleurotus eryngii TaxID=5323 RepID=A0A9P5ZLW9_PLEER|nr:hypothetical protein BDN71DRAFT_256955 [Pleurotus eryngii]